MKCGVCGAFMPIRSNQGVVEEVSRLADHLRQPDLPACPTEGCQNFGVPVDVEGRYARFGKTAAGSPRWRCKACSRTFAEEGSPLRRQRKTHKDRDVFVQLVNKVPLRWIGELTGLGPKAVYGKLAFIHRQCLAFVASRESDLLHMLLPSMYVAVDRQAHTFMQTRRLLSMAERSLSTASKAGRVWYGYAAYKPANLVRTLEIFRVYYNYCKVGRDKQTPAMRLGLAKAPIKPEDILYYSRPHVIAVRRVKAKTSQTSPSSPAGPSG